MIGTSDWPARDRSFADTARKAAQGRLPLLVLAAASCAVVVACAIGPFGTTATTRLCSLR